jgi:phosphohistidine phosphatase
MLLLIRHAHALQGTDDAARPLSKRGQKQIRLIARFLKATGSFDAKEVWHSPLVRSRDTAEKLVERIGARSKLIETAGLQPDDDPALVAQRLHRVRRSVAVVGHEPHLSALATLLVTGNAQPAIVKLKKCSVLALDRAGDGRWTIHWLISPRLSA